MSVKIVQSGRELEIRSAVEYLERAYNIPAGHIRGVTVDGEVGRPMTVTVSVYVQAEEPDDERADPLSPCPGCLREATWLDIDDLAAAHASGHPSAPKPYEEQCPGCRASVWPKSEDRVHAHASGHPEMRNR